MAYRSCYFRRDDGTKLNRYFIFDTAAELLTSTLIVGDMAYTVDTGAFYVADSTTTWDLISSGSGAPTTCTYLTVTSDPTLSAERVLTAGANITFSDTGANGTLTINAASGSATPGGSDTQVQFNDGGALGGDAHFTWNKTTDTLSLDSDPTIRTPDVTGASNSEDLTIATGYAGGTGNGGHLRIEGGDAAGSTANGGSVSLLAGSGGSGSGFNAGEIDISAGSGGTLGGSVYLRGGDASATNGDGGYVVLTGGDGRGTGLGGIVELDGDSHTYTADPVSWFQFFFSPSVSTTISSGVTITKYAFSYFDTGNVNGVAGGATETVTTLSNVYIEDAPGGSNRTVTNGPYALLVDDGLSRFDGGLAIEGSTTKNVFYGTYTPTRSAEANTDANVTMTEAQYMRLGNTVTVSGRFTADPTLTATATSFEITLPVASNIGAVEDCAGVAFCGIISGMGAEVIGVVANDTAKIQWVASDITSQTWSYTFTYQVI